MLKRKNENINPLKTEIGDFVYLLADNDTIGSKLDNKFLGPFVIERVVSPHIVDLIDPETSVLKQNIHVNRLKPGHIRINDPKYVDLHPELIPPLASRKLANYNPPKVTEDTKAVNQNECPRRKSDRLAGKAKVIFIDPSQSDTSDNAKVRKFLGMREVAGQHLYLTHLKGESSKNAIWLPLSRLTTQAKKYVKENPPPSI